MPSHSSLASFLPLELPNFLAIRSSPRTADARKRLRISAPNDPVILTSSPPVSESRARDEMSVFGAPALTMAPPPQYYSSPPPDYKPSTLSIQQSPLGSHPMPILPPPPSDKRPPSPAPSALSPPSSLHDLPRYTPRESISARDSAAKAKPRPSANTWAAWIPWNWLSPPRRSGCTIAGSTGQGSRDQVDGDRGIELDAHEQQQYELDQQPVAREDKHRERYWCCGCF
ncbi:uncharacterized protein L3040_003045 [Drepanopeziza brunnea f. sp. 'multigermtubi']|uniref:Uncharacterized protein n=1 Tax=Marssonina brunnea f. sp. multigermtubi (strain MB_m1) TaxID=1072389 RepID=K1XLB7_MARBU|nr:uncharacterized protein MBM_08687 [Drepanopeziza brunnea f. sp. 'multigermtubi' MB_m1]EKD13244.1 hypothetical protein MBM_08687 [Drepanopeziza brunnea f. sp. 'multigermtubi' MB_m1]KAJ5047204.1 hypothetical protein L3040_003045 [Drepanopeziza brunnea f. sp. 'multigermtubi']